MRARMRFLFMKMKRKKDKTASSELNKTDQTVEKKDDKETTKDNSTK